MPAPVRGTQSFVSVMGQVWRRPSLAALEIAWRWPAGALLISVALWQTLNIPASRALENSALGAISVFQPAAACNTIVLTLTALIPSFPPLTFGLLPLLFLLWNLIAAFGRTLVLRRLDPALRARRVTLFTLGTVRALLLLAAWTLWFCGVAFAARIAITAPAARGEEPSVVLFAAMLIGGTLLLYVAWGIFSWFLYLAPLLAMQRKLNAFAALRAALASNKDLRGRLIEINLVMNIVRIALIVLAMVFSATPLPFTEVATPEFLRLWWAGVFLLYLAFSDYFHVVRAAAYLSLHHALDRALNSPV